MPRALLLATLLLAVSAPRALAQGSDEEARATFDRGTEAYNEGRYHEAAQEYERAYQLSPRALILLNVSRAYERALEPGPAADALERYLAEEPNPEDEEALRARLVRLRELAGNASPAEPETPPEEPPAIHWTPLPMGPERRPQQVYPPPPSAPPPPSLPPPVEAPPPDADPSASAVGETDEEAPPATPAPTGPNPIGVSAAVFGGAAVILTAVGIGLGVSVNDDVDRLSRRCSREGVCPPSQADAIRDSWVRAQGANISGGLGLVVGIAALAQVIAALREELRGPPTPGVRVDARGIRVEF